MAYEFRSVGATGAQPPRPEGQCTRRGPRSRPAATTPRPRPRPPAAHPPGYPQTPPSSQCPSAGGGPPDVVSGSGSLSPRPRLPHPLRTEGRCADPLSHPDPKKVPHAHRHMPPPSAGPGAHLALSEAPGCYPLAQTVYLSAGGSRRGRSFRHQRSTAGGAPRPVGRSPGDGPTFLRPQAEHTCFPSVPSPPRRVSSTPQK